MRAMCSANTAEHGWFSGMAMLAMTACPADVYWTAAHAAIAQSGSSTSRAVTVD
jgi:hypothetical protein